MKIEDKVRKQLKARINSIKNFKNRPYTEKEKRTDTSVMHMHKNMPYRDRVSYLIENIVTIRLKKYED